MSRLLSGPRTRDSLTTAHRPSVLNKIVTSRAFSFAQLLTAAIAWGIWYQNPSAWWALAIPLFSLALRVVGGQAPIRRTPLDGPLVLFMLTAGLGVWTAYDRTGDRITRFRIPVMHNRIGGEGVFPQTTPVGWQTLWGLILALFVFYALAAMETKGQHGWALALLAGLGAVVAVWFAAANDWTANPAKLDLITRLGKLTQRLLPALSGYWLNTNILGGVIALQIPASLGLVAAGQGRWRERWPWLAWGLATGMVMALGLMLTTSRGAWMGVAVSLALAGLWGLAGRVRRGPTRLHLFALVIIVGVLMGGMLLAIWPALRSWVLIRYSLTDRAGIFAESALLARDYLLTGYGLGQFALLHSTYALLIHVPILPYAHSLFLDVVLCQGIVGLLALVGAMGGAAWLGLSRLAHAGSPSPALTAGLLGLVVMAVHGVVDDPLYVSQWMPLLWVPAGLAVAGWRQVRERPRLATLAAASRHWVWGLVALCAVVLIALFWRPIAAIGYADLGAVYQAQIELSRYDYEHFDRPLLDEIRRQADLSTAERFFERALALDPGQVTARTRLAEIALSRGDYEQALTHAQAAWDAGQRDRVTRLLLGDALVAVGELERAVDVVSGVAGASGRLDFQAWYRYWLGEDYRRAADAWRAVVQLDPENERAARSIGEAEQRARNP